MDLSVSAEDDAFRQKFRAWLEENKEDSWGEPIHDPTEHFEAKKRFGQKLFASGWGAYGWPEDIGGKHMTATQSAIFGEERARIGAPEAGGGMGLIARALYDYGTPKQKEYLKGIQDYTSEWVIGYSEPDAGSDLVGIRTRATKVDGGWKINGRKCWTSWAQFSDYCYLLTRTGTQESKGNGLTLFCVDMKNTPGIEIRPLRQAMGHAEFNEVLFDDVFLSEDALLGEVDGGWRIVNSLWSKERGPAYAFRHFVNIRNSLERIVEVNRSAETPATLESLGQMYGRAFASQLLAFELLEFEEKKNLPDGFSSVVKMYITETWRRQGKIDVFQMNRSQLNGLEGHVGPDWLFDFIESMHYTISAGTSEIQRNAISRGVLKLPSSKAKAKAKS